MPLDVAYLTMPGMHRGSRPTCLEGLMAGSRPERYLGNRWELCVQTSQAASGSICRPAKCLIDPSTDLRWVGPVRSFFTLPTSIS